MDSVLHSRKNNEFFRQLLFIAVLITIGVITFTQLKFFVGSVLGAFTLYIVFRSWLFHITEVWGWRNWVAGLFLTTVCAIILGVFGYLIFTVVASEIPAVDASQIVARFNSSVDQVNQIVGYDVMPENVVEKSGGVISKVATMLLNTTYSFAANIFMMLVIVYFLFAKGRKMECYAYRYAPFRGSSLQMIRSEVKNMIYSNAVGIPAIMVAQTITASFIYWIIGMDSYLFWGFLTAICGLVPLIGTGIVYGGIGIYYAATGEIWTAVIIVLYGIVIISNTDNVFRIILLKKVNDTHPLVVIFGVILGIPLFGFWGIIFGPLFISAFLLLIRIYYYEYGLLSSKEDAEKLAKAPLVWEEPPIKTYDSIRVLKAIKRLRTGHVHPIVVSQDGKVNNSGDDCSCVGNDPKHLSKKKKGKKFFRK